MKRPGIPKRRHGLRSSRALVSSGGAVLWKRTRIRRQNAARKAREFVRCFHSAERVAWVRQLPCVVSGESPCDNAHSVGDGTSRRAGYETIVPLVRRLHRELHRTGVVTFSAKYAVDLPALAAETQRRWLTHTGVAA